MDIELQHLSLPDHAIDHPQSPIASRSHSQRRAYGADEDLNVGARNERVAAGIQEEEPDVQLIPPTDRGPDAWKMLFAACIFEALLWGFPLTYGIFQAYYSLNAPFSISHPSLLPLIGTLATAITYMGAPIITPLLTASLSHHRQIITIGWALTILSLVGASFANNTPTLVATQGIMYGVGELTLFFPILSMVNEWFLHRRGLAYGILSCSTGVSGLIFPFICTALLDCYGHRTALRCLAVGLGVTTAPLIPFLKNRLPATRASAPQPQNYRAHLAQFDFVRRPLFGLYAAANMFHGLAFFLPLLWIPTYAASAGLAPSSGALLLALVSLAQVGGQLTFGWISDNGGIDLHTLMFVSPFISAVAAFLLWGLAHGMLVPLIIFSLMYGFFAAGYVVLWARMGMALVGGVDNGTIGEALATYSVFWFEKGVGNVLAGPVSAVLLRGGGRGSLGEGYGGRFGGIIVFTGACMVVSSGIAGVGGLRRVSVGWRARR